MGLMATLAPTFSLGARKDPAKRGAWDPDAHPFTTHARRERPTHAWFATLMRIVSKSLLLVISQRMKSCCTRTFLSSGVSALQISTRSSGMIKSKNTNSTLTFYSVDRMNDSEWCSSSVRESSYLHERNAMFVKVKS